MKVDYTIHRRSVSKYVIGYFLLLCFFAINNTISAADEIKPVYAKEPELIIAKIKNIGATEVVKEISENESGWSWVLQQIATANDEWLKVAVMLREATDAGTSTMLEDAVTSALIT